MSKPIKHTFKFYVDLNLIKCKEYTLEYYLTEDEYMIMNYAMMLGIDFCDVDELHDLYSYLSDLAVDEIANELKKHRKYWQDEYEYLVNNTVGTDDEAKCNFKESLKEQAIRNVAKNLFAGINF